jgi:Raf kinase inhibitor-like YbhB/YbcL family protein
MVMDQPYYCRCPFTIMRIWRTLLCLIVLAAGACIVGCSAPSTPSASPSAFQTDQPASLTSPVGTQSETLSLQVDSLSPGSLLPGAYTCTGTSESPEVAWTGIPAGTKSLVLILDDPDAPRGIFTHWLVYNIPPAAGGIGRGQPNAKVLASGAQQGDNSAGSRGYYPPCPPIGTMHRYVFRLYAVDTEITQPTANRESVDAALIGHTLGKSEFVTSFGR